MKRETTFEIFTQQKVTSVFLALLKYNTQNTQFFYKGVNRKGISQNFEVFITNLKASR